MILFGVSVSLLGLALWLLRISDRQLDEAKAILDRAARNNDSALAAVDKIAAFERTLMRDFQRTFQYDFEAWAEQFKGDQL